MISPHSCHRPLYPSPYLPLTLLVEHNSGPGILHVWLLPHHHVVGQAMWCAVARFGRIPNSYDMVYLHWCPMSKQCHMFSIMKPFYTKLFTKPCHCTPHCLCKDILYVNISWYTKISHLLLVTCTCIFVRHGLPSLVSHVQTM